MADLPHGIITVATNRRIAQLIVDPLHLLPSKCAKTKREQTGFGSFDVHQVQSITSKRSNLKFIIEEKSFEGLIDTGADVLTHFQGIGYSNNPKQSSKLKIYERLMKLGTYEGITTWFNSSSCLSKIQE